jgi:hypothetical protein
MEINKAEFGTIFENLLRTWLNVRKFTGEFKIIWAKDENDTVKIELYYDENNSKEMVERLSKKLCRLKK